MADDEVETVEEEQVLLDMQGIGAWLATTAAAMEAMEGSGDTPDSLLRLPREVDADELRIALLASVNLANMAGLTAEQVQQESMVYAAITESEEGSDDEQHN